MCFIAGLYLPSSGKFLLLTSCVSSDHNLNLVQIPDKRLDDDALSDTSSTTEEIRDDEDKIVRPCQKHHTV